MKAMASSGSPQRPAFEAQVDSLMTASRVLVALSVRTLGSVRPGVTPVQLRALALVSGSTGLTMTELADALGVHPSNATRVCDRLVGLGLVRRREHRDNRRMLSVELTPDGERLLAHIMTVRRHALAEILATLPGPRRAQLADELSAFVTAAHAALPDSDLTALGWAPGT